MTDELPGDGLTLGVVGGGQLGRMLAEAAAPLGVEVVVVDPTERCPASAVARDQIVGDFDDLEALRELADRADALTYEIELADADHLALVGRDAGVPIHPSPDTLRVTQDKLLEKETLERRDVPVPAFAAVDDAADLEAAFDELGAPLMLKARTGGYDGRGNAPVETVAEAEDAFGSLDGLVAEELVDFERELSTMGVRGAGETDAFPVVENVHEAEILRETVAPARTDDAVIDRAREVALDVLDALDGRGVFGIELFETADGEILVNEIAPRPHNSGHYTIEGARTSQFEQHVRAVLGHPLGSTALRGPTVMANLLGTVDSPRPVHLRGLHDLYATAGVHLHWYGKREVRPLRKMGHVTAEQTADESTDDLLDRARSARDGIAFDD